MRFGFFRDRLCDELIPTRFSFTPLPLNLNLAGIAPQSPTTPTSSAPPTFTAAQLKEKLRITEQAAQLLTDGGKLTLTEQQVLERLKSSEIKTYDISKRGIDSNLDSFENSRLLKEIDNLDGQSGNIKVKDGKLAWEAAGATVTEPPNNPSSTRSVNPTPPPNTPSLTKEAGFAGPEFNPPDTKNDTKTIQSALVKIGGDKNQKIQYQGVLLTDSSYGSDNVRLYSVGEGDNTNTIL
jgi:hypothetical protein